MKKNEWQFFWGLWSKFHPGASFGWRVLPSGYFFNQAGSNHTSSSYGINRSVLACTQTSPRSLTLGFNWMEEIASLLDLTP